MEKVKLSSSSTGSSEKFKRTWDDDNNNNISTNFNFERDHRFLFSWPPRNYTCSFCKKQFRSAQALGGHMNVHRRDRAKQMTAALNQQQQQQQQQKQTNHNPNPNPRPNPNPNYLPQPILLAKPAVSARFLPYNMIRSTNNHASSALMIPPFYNSHHAHIDEDNGELVSSEIRDIRKKLVMEANNTCKGYGFKKQEADHYDNKYGVWRKREFLGLGLNLSGQITDIARDQGLDLELRLGSL